MRAVIVGAVVAAVTCAAARAHADDRLVLIDPPAPLAKAAHEQLAPYRIDVVVAPAPTRGDARAIAAHFHARAVARLDGDELVVFDPTGTPIARRPAPAPLDDASAAALALTLKTMLRTRWDAEDAAAAAAAPAPPPSDIEAELAAGLRLHGTAAEPRLTLGASARAGAVLLGVRGSLGDGISVDAGRFTGTWNDRAIGAIALWPWVSGDLAVRAGGGVSLHWTDIHGVLLPAGDAAQADALNVGIDGEVTALWQRRPIALGVRLAGTWVPWRQRYTVSDVAVFEVSHAEGEIGVVVIFAF